MTGVRVEYQGLSTLIGVIHQAPKAAETASMGSMVRTANVVFNESQIQVPVRHGVLKGSGSIDVDEQNKEVDISYGGPAGGYALFVHENTMAQHRPPTKAKYLEDPMNEHAGELTGDMGEQFEVAIMTQHPGAVSSTQRAEVSAAMKRAFPHKSQAALAKEISRSRAMSPAEVKIALQAMRKH